MLGEKLCCGLGQREGGLVKQKFYHKTNKKRATDIIEVQLQRSQKRLTFRTTQLSSVLMAPARHMYVRLGQKGERRGRLREKYTGNTVIYY